MGSAAGDGNGGRQGSGRRGDAQEGRRRGDDSNFVEWYDFIIYGYFATVIAAQFFPSEDPLAGILATFAVFGVSFLVRPLGAIVMGSYGDRLGSRGTLAVVILLMSGATFLIGVAPTYAQVGALAPIILALARALQGSRRGASSVGRRRS